MTTRFSRKRLSWFAVAFALIGFLALTVFRGSHPAGNADPTLGGTARHIAATVAARPGAATTGAGAPSSPGDPAAAALPDGVSPPAERLQRRLDAIAEGYNAGDTDAIARAFWPNHALVRPDGATMYRSDLLAQWGADWTHLKDRHLSFFVEELTVDGPKVTALWSLLLTAQIVDAHGEVHAYQFHGFQTASYARSGDQEVLDGPITYTGFDQLLDAEPWHGDFREL